MARPDVVVSFGGEASGLTRTMAGIRSSISGLTPTVTGLQAAISGLGVGAFFSKVVTATEESQAATRQLEATMKSTGGIAGYTTDELLGLAAAFQEVSNYEDDAVTSMLAVLGTFTAIKDRGIFKDASQAILDLSAKMGQDLKTSAVQVGKSLNDPIAGLTALKRVGVSFSDAQEEAIKKMVKMNNAAGAQKMILAELNKEFGGSAKAAISPMTQLANAWGNLFESTYNTEGAVNSLTKTLSSPEVKSAFETITSAVITLVGWMAEGSGKTAEFMDSLGKKLAKAAADASGLVAFEDVDAKINELKGKLETLRGYNLLQRAILGDNWQKAIKDLKDEIDRLTKLKESVDSMKPGEKKPAPAGKDKPGSAEGLDGGPSKSFADQRAKEAVADKQAADSKVSGTRQVTRIEGELWKAFYAEKLALQQKDADAAAKAQEEQEAQYARLRGAGASKSLQEYYAKLVGGKDGEPEIKTKWKMEMVLDQASFSDVQGQLNAGLQDLKGQIWLEVNPSLAATSETPGNVGAMDIGMPDAIGREADQTGAQP